MSAKHIAMFQCDNCNYSDSFNLTKVSNSVGDGAIIALPEGWWVGLGLVSGSLKIFCAGSNCTKEKLATKCSG